METGFLNFHDEEHFSTMPTPLMYDQGEMLDDSESSLLDMIPEDFPRYSVRDPWDQDSEQELNGDIATLPRPLTETIRSKEDFHKMLNEWQEHLGSMQTSDNDEIYDNIEPLTEDLPGMDIFDESSFDGDDLSSNKKLDKTQTKKTNKLTGKKVVGKDLALGHFIADDDDDETDRLLILENNLSSIENNRATLDDAENMDDAFRIDVDDDCIDVETVTGSEQIPVLEAVDVTSLLEQFEASESVNTTSSLSKNQTELDNHLFAMATQRVSTANSLAASPKPSLTMSHQNIIDALPKEVIERIKASGRKKAIPVIPAMPSKKLGRAGTRMQDAGVALSRNKLLKIVSSGTVTGESVQLDHDYCSASSNSSPQPDVVPMRSFYHSDPSDYGREEKPKPSKPAEKVYSRLPDYYLVMAPQIGAAKKESDSRKDSGLESGDVSDSSEELASEKTCSASKPVYSDVAKSSASNSDGLKTLNKSATTVTTVRDKIVTINGKDINLGSIMQNVNKALVESKINTKNTLAKTNKDAPMVSVLKRNSSLDDTAVVKEIEVKKEVVEDKCTDVQEVNEPKKRKLNLSEYRNRVKELDRCRDSCESSRASSPVTPDIPTLEEAKQIFEQATQMLINAKGQIDEESFAEMKKTLVKQSALKMPAHESHQEEYRPRFIRIKVEKPAKIIQSPVEEKRVKEMILSPTMEVKTATLKVQSPVVGDRSANEMRSPATEELSSKKTEAPIVIKSEFSVNEEPSVNEVDQTCTVSPRHEVSDIEIDDIEMDIEEHVPDVKFDILVQPSADNELDSTMADMRSISDEPNVLMDVADCSLTNEQILIEEVRVAEICPEHFDIEPADPLLERVGVHYEDERRVANNDEQIQADLAARRERNKTRDCEDVGAANKSQRSRRQYRSHRTNSSSSSSSSNSHTSRRRPSDKTRTERLPPKLRSRSRSSSSSNSSRSRSSSHSKTAVRGWQNDRRSNERRQRDRRSCSSHSQKSYSSYRENRRRSRSPRVRGPEYQLTEREKERQVEERRVIYVGRIDEGMTKVELRTHFETFGPIVDISVHFREHGDNYGFVTFAYKVDAYAAVEQGKKDPVLGQYDLSFGGRRAFCKARYSDLDGNRQDDDYGYSNHRGMSARQRPSNDVNFDDLLREALKKKKEVAKSKV